MSTLRVNNMTNVGGDGSTYAKGHVVQVVSNSTTASLTTTSTTFVDVPNLNVTITPKFASSKILVSYNAYTNSQTQGNETFVTVFRGSTNLNATAANSGFGGLYTGAGGWTAVVVSGSISDSPSTTSPVTYSIKFRSGAGATANVNPANQVATITVMEVAA